jgi:hypothetical protein
MRTNFNVIVANVNVFGYGQDRVVVSSLFGTCAHAAQHLETRHTSKRARGWAQRVKRSWLATAAMAGAARMAELIMMSLAITGPQRLPVRHLSPVLVLA